EGRPVGPENRAPQKHEREQGLAPHPGAGVAQPDAQPVEEAGQEETSFTETQPESPVPRALRARGWPGFFSLNPVALSRCVSFSLFPLSLPSVERHGGFWWGRRASLPIAARSAHGCGCGILTLGWKEALRLSDRGLLLRRDPFYYKPKRPDLTNNPRHARKVSLLSSRTTTKSLPP